MGMALNQSIETDENTIPTRLKLFLIRRGFELAGIICFLAIVAVAASLASWSIADPSFNHATGSKPTNWLGAPGAIIADQLIQILGLASLPFLFIPMKWIMGLFDHQLPIDFRRSGLSWIGATISFGCLLACFPASSFWHLASGMGGNVGDILSGLVFSILAIGIKGLVAKSLVAILAFAGFIWTSMQALELSNVPALLPTARAKKPKRALKFEQPKRASWKQKLVGIWTAIASARPKPKLKAAKAAQQAPASEDVLSRFAPLNLKKSPKAKVDRIEPSLVGGHSEEDLIDDFPAELDEEFVDPLEVIEEDGVEEMPAASKKPLTKSLIKSKIKPTENHFELPPLTLLSEPKKAGRQPEFAPEFLAENARRLEGVLEDFGVRGQIINVRPGPVVTLYELEPAPGIKSSRVISLADDIARSMSAISARVAVVAGRNAIGIELPNPKRETVYLRELMQTESFINNNTTLALALGKNIGGEPIFADLARMPHLLIAGTTGSGKSVGINTMILSLLYRLPPDKCKLIMIDPKMLELSVYEGIPHLLAPVVTDPRKAVVALKWAVREMEDRYKKMSKTGVRNVDGYNTKITQMIAKGEKLSRTVQTGFEPDTGKPIFEQEDMDLQPMPYIVVIIDEMADLMMVAGKDIEGAVQRLAQMARAAGIHVVMATQRPSVDVITGTIKANFPTRISFQVTSKIDSRTILGEQGAEQLLGQGDMLYMAGGGRISRLHAPFVTDSEVEEIVNHLKAQGQPEYVEAVTEEVDEDEMAGEGGGMAGAIGGSGDELYDQAVAVVLRDKKVSTSYVQRRLQVGYNKAASLIERMEKEGLISAANATGKREILVPGDSARV
jgi:DNA segregation ATPase FtsK/SpoIIIE, S-DNA-T family